MGMSAGQARLLSVTSRLTDNELRSQMLTNSKLRLADKSTEASNKYMDALNSQQLMYTSYDGSGNKITEALTANTILNYADLKNQYAMVNTAGQVLVSGTDAVNFSKSNTLSEFLGCYGISEVDNPNYTKQLENVYGTNYSDFFDENNIYGIYNDSIINSTGLRGQMNNFVSYNDATKQYEMNPSLLTISDTNGDGINELIISSNYATDLENYVSSLGYDKLSDGCVYKNLLNGALDIIKNVPSLSVPVKEAYPEEPQQADYQIPYVDSLYKDTFINAFNQYPGLYDESTGKFNVEMSSNYTSYHIGISAIMQLLLKQDAEKINYKTSFSTDYEYPTEVKDDFYTNKTFTYWEGDNLYEYANYYYGSDYDQKGIDPNDFAALRDAIWKDYKNGDPLNELQQAIVDATYFFNSVQNWFFYSQPTNSVVTSGGVQSYEPVMFKIKKDDADKAHDMEVYEKAKADYEIHPLGEEERIIYEKAAEELTKDYYEISSDLFQEDTNMWGSIENPNVAYLFEKMTNNVIKLIKLNGNPETVDDVASYQTAYAEYEAEKLRIDQDYEAAVQSYNAKLQDLADQYEQSLIQTYQKYLVYENNYKLVLDNIETCGKTIPDESDSRYQWYKNLWYRMGGTSETTKDESGMRYKELDPALLNNSEWLEFALEHGVITLEQAQYNEKGSTKYPNMGNYDWNSIIYTNASDIVSQDDEVAIAKAEVEYENALKEIENEDKKIDQDLKKLDTEHNALQTEYESIKGVIDKNVERSFKAFS